MQTGGGKGNRPGRTIFSADQYIRRGGEGQNSAGIRNSSNL